MPMIARGFDSYIKKSTNGCWHWTGGISQKTGYGMCSIERTPYPAHRHAYERVHGKLPRRGEPGHMQVDHECHNRSKSCKGGEACLHRRCVNPAHLVAKSAAENTHASPRATAAVNARKTHCGVCGTELVEPNIYLYNNGRKRQCKCCTERRKQERKRRLAGLA